MVREPSRRVGRVPLIGLILFVTVITIIGYTVHIIVQIINYLRGKK